MITQLLWGVLVPKRHSASVLPSVPWGKKRAGLGINFIQDTYIIYFFHVLGIPSKERIDR